MKKVLYSLGLLAIVAGATVSFQSCNKIKDEIKGQINPFNFTQQDITLTVPALSGTDTSSQFATSVPLNISQVIADNNTSGISVGYDDISSIKIKKITLTLVEGMSSTSNYTNYEGIFFAANTDIGKAKNLSYQGVWAGIDDLTANQYAPVVLEFPAPQTNLKEYFTKDGNTNCEYYLQAAMRRSTVPMKVRAVVEYEMAF
jgi:hypothetical protein